MIRVLLFRINAGGLDLPGQLWRRRHQFAPHRTAVKQHFFPVRKSVAVIVFIGSLQNPQLIQLLRIDLHYHPKIIPTISIKIMHRLLPVREKGANLRLLLGCLRTPVFILSGGFFF